MQPKRREGHKPASRGGRFAIRALAALLGAGAGAVAIASADAQATLRVGRLPPAAVASASRAAIAAIHADARPDQLTSALTEQAFSVEGSARVLYLVPVSYASAKAKNGVCDLVVMDDHFKPTGQARLFGADFDGDEVVARCTNVLAAGFVPRASEHRIEGVYLMATGVINTYRTAAEVVTIDTVSGSVRADDKRTAAIDDGKEPQSVGPLMARLRRLP
jgi:hypothetical protein